ncbi:hypothetical protein LCGC14_1761970 [marine sediment metagenome]|uniref:DUF4037 domain-containing protein n=1 Tax=marine sediment metagenome TaxID=412755 RepID=A0A0F9H0Q6_9ZZZZ
MKGLDLHRDFFRECGRPLLAKTFPDEFPQIAAASVGFGSDRLGADDEFSQDHAWEPGFQIFSDRLPRDLLKRIESHLYENMPWEFRGVRRSDCCGSPNTIRAWTVDEFFASMTSFARPPERDRLWLLMTDEALYHVTNGEVFYDPTGDFTKRRELFGYYPENVWRFKLAGRAHRIDVQRYQMERCAAHGEEVAADLMLWEGLREVFHFACLINRRYAPNDRWLHWVFRRLPALAGDIEPLVARISRTTDMSRRLSLYEKIVASCAGWAYEHGLATKGKYWWADLREAVQGELRAFPVPSWVGVEYKYSSQFALGGSFRGLLTESGQQVRPADADRPRD